MACATLHPHVSTLGHCNHAEYIQHTAHYSTHLKLTKNAGLMTLQRDVVGLTKRDDLTVVFSSNNFKRLKSRQLYYTAFLPPRYNFQLLNQRDASLRVSSRADDAFSTTIHVALQAPAICKSRCSTAVYWCRKLYGWYFATFQQRV